MIHLEGEPGFALLHVEGEVGGILGVVGVEGWIPGTKVDQHCEVVRHAALHSQQCTSVVIWSAVLGGFGGATRPCATRTRIFRLINKQNGALHTTRPAQCSFADPSGDDNNIKKNPTKKPSIR